MKPTRGRSPSASELGRGARAIKSAREHFRKLRDPRLRKGKRHRLVDTVLIALLGVLCDCDDESTRTDVLTSKQTSERRYYITSDGAMTAERALELTRGHWSVENNLHWVLDVVFGEDASRIRTKRAAENFSILRRLALSLIGAAPPPNKAMSIKRRRRYCAHSPEYLDTVLSAASALG